MMATFRFTMNTKRFDAALAGICVILLIMAMYWLNSSLNNAYIRAGDSKATFVMLLLITTETVICIFAYRFFRRLFNAIP